MEKDKDLGAVTLMDIPLDVLKVWAISYSTRYVGLEMYNWIQSVIDKYPQYFEWEHKYRKVPQEVHEAYLDEIYPDRHKPLQFSKEGSSGLLSTHQPQELKPPTREDVINFFTGLQRDRDNAISEEVRIRKIWDKHYKKFGLEYRK